MSKESRQRLREAAQIHHRHSNKRRLMKWTLAVTVLVAIGASVLLWKHRADLTPTIADSPPASGFNPPAELPALCKLTTNEIGQCDIALMNLLCAQRLHGSENLDIPKCLERLDGIAKYVNAETDRHYYKFREHPAEFENSEGYYRMMMMVTVLQQDLGIHYNPARARLLSETTEASDKFFADSKDVFIHGLIREGGTGTCSSMPVFLVSVGRRLGYPLKLVRAKGHLFARWDEGSRSFNIEGTSIGFVSHPDSEYRNWPAPFTTEEETAECYLKSLTPVQELATFLTIRGHCCLASGDMLQAVGSFSQALKKEPQSVGNKKLFAWSERKAYETGALPKRMAVQYALRTLEIPPGPMQSQWMAKKNDLQARNLLEQDEQQIELDLELLKVEIAAHQR